MTPLYQFGRESITTSINCLLRSFQEDIYRSRRYRGRRLQRSKREGWVVARMSARFQVLDYQRCIRHPTACSERSKPSSRSGASTLPFRWKMYSNRKEEARKYHALQTRTRYLFVTLQKRDVVSDRKTWVKIFC